MLTKFTPGYLNIFTDGKDITLNNQNSFIIGIWLKANMFLWVKTRQLFCELTVKYRLINKHSFLQIYLRASRRFVSSQQNIFSEKSVATLCPYI